LSLFGSVDPRVFFNGKVANDAPETVPDFFIHFVHETKTLAAARLSNHEVYRHRLLT
jgi:hypothetical protein